MFSTLKLADSAAKKISHALEVQSNDSEASNNSSVTDSSSVTGGGFLNVETITVAESSFLKIQSIDEYKIFELSILKGKNMEIYVSFISLSRIAFQCKRC